MVEAALSVKILGSLFLIEKLMERKRIALVNCRIPTRLPENERGCVIIEDSRILDVCGKDSLPTDVEVVDMEGCYLSPGFIDLLANGAGGGAFGVTADIDDLKRMGQTMMDEGTTGFLAAAPSNTLELYKSMQQSLREHKYEIPQNFMGLHLEGPYFSMEYRGAHREDCVRSCDDAELKDLFDTPDHYIWLMSVAPEKITDAQVKFLEDKGIKISFAHSGVSYKEAISFLQKPHRSVTHLYNGMPAMHHRKPGHIPAIFHVKPLTGIIVDGVHVSYPMVRMAYEIMPESLYLFTDRFTRCPAMGVLYDAEHDYCVRQLPDGGSVICGSALSMLKAVRNSVEQVGIPLREALEMASLRPAKVLGLDNLFGKIEQGYAANLVAFDEDWQVKRVMFAGKWVR